MQVFAATKQEYACVEIHKFTVYEVIYGTIIEGGIFTKGERKYKIVPYEEFAKIGHWSEGWILATSDDIESVEDGGLFCLKSEAPKESKLVQFLPTHKDFIKAKYLGFLQQTAKSSQEVKDSFFSFFANK